MQNLNGRIITYFNSNPHVYNYIYLIIFAKDNSTVKNNNLTNYAFKYINAKRLTTVEFSSQDNADIIYLKDGSSRKITIESIKCYSCFITYFVNFLPRSALIANETFDNSAVVESTGYTKEIDNKTYKVNYNKTDLIITGIPDDIDYAHIQIIAHVERGIINEYIAYNTLYLEPNNYKNNDDSKNTQMIIIIAVISGLFIIIVTSLIIIVLKCNKRNKDLINKVNATSFNNDSLFRFDKEDENNRNLLLG